jgi:O-antigen/teichoic acid export membrane protein
MNLAWNVVTTLLARLGLLLFALLSSVLMARTLGPEGRGLLALVLLLPALAKTVALLGFEHANAVYAGLEPDRRRALVWQSAAIAAVVGGMFAIAGMAAVAAGGLGIAALVQGPLWLYLLAFVTVPCALITEYWGAILRGMNRIGVLNLATVGTTVASLVLIVVFIVWLRLDVAGALWAECVISVASVILMAALLKSVGAWGRPTFDRALWWRSVRFALPAHGATLAAYLNYRVDELVIAALLPPEDLGFYVLAVGIAERLWIIPGAAATALLPHLSTSPRRDPALAATMARHVTLWTGAACLLIFALAHVFIETLYSAAFTRAVTPLRWLLLGIFTLTIGKVLVAELLVREKPRYTVYASGMAAVVNLAANLVLVPRLGISGAALASSVSYSLLSILVTRYYLRETGLSWTELVPRWSDLQIYYALFRRGRPQEAYEA